mgnify:FL=1
MAIIVGLWVFLSWGWVCSPARCIGFPCFRACGPYAGTGKLYRYCGVSLLIFLAAGNYLPGAELNL